MSVCGRKEPNIALQVVRLHSRAAGYRFSKGVANKDRCIRTHVRCVGFYVCMHAGHIMCVSAVN